MIQANELRIGNWINIPESGINAKIDIVGLKRFCIDNRGIDLNDDQTDFDLKSGFGIPLTPEILIACGFKMDNFSKKYKLNVDDDSREYFIVLEEDGFVLEHNAGSYCEGASLKLYHIKYLHQLQNAFYILTSKELNYQP